MKITLQLASFLRNQKSCTAFAVLAALQFSHSAQAQVTGFNQTGAGPYNYNDTANWVGGTINGIWDAGLTVTTGQIVEFGTSTVLTTGLTFRDTVGVLNKTLRSTGGATTLTLGGDVLMNTNGNATNTIGSTSSAQNLHVDLGGVVRTITAFGGGNGGNFARTFTFTNNVFNGGIIASGGGSGGGKIQFNALAISLSSATVKDAELSFNGSNNNSANSVYTISGALTADGGASTVSVTPRSSATARNALVTAGSFARSAGSTILFRGTALGTTTVASATANTANISFGTSPTLSGVVSGSGTTTGIIAGAFGDTSSTGTGFGATAGLVTYDSANGVRLLSGSEYKTSITDGQTGLDNVRLTNSTSGDITPVIANTNLTSATTILNSLSLSVSGATGNQGITITGDVGTTLKLYSGVIYADQNVTGANSAATDAMTISVPTLDLNGQEGIILANTKMNTGGTTVSNGALIINSTIANGTGLTIGDGFATNPSSYVVFGGASANTYTGNTTINGAIVRLGKTALNTFGNVVVNLGSVYDSGNQIADTSDLTINGGTFFLNGSNNSGSATSETINNFTMGNGGVNWGQGTGNIFTVNGNAGLSGGSVSMPLNAKFIVGGTTSLSGGVISTGTNNSTTVYNSKTTLTGAVSITNTAQGTVAYTPITIAAGSAAGHLGGQVLLSSNLTFTGNTNTNTVTIAAPAGTGQQGVIALNDIRTFNIGDGAAAVDLTVAAPLISGGGAPGGLIKTGAGTLALNGTNSYSEDTTVSAGTLSLGTPSLADSSAVNVADGAFLNLPHGLSDTVAEFQIDGVSQGNGTFTSANSSGRITGTGSLQVGPSSDPYLAWIATYPTITGLDTAKGADPDKDGLTNVVEFALDGNPASGAASGKVRSQIETVGVDQALVVTLPVRAGAVFDNTPGPAADATINNMVYIIAGTNDLMLFDQGVTEIPVSAVGMPALTSASWTYKTFRLNGAVGGGSPRGPKGFLRVSIQETP